MSSAQVYYVYLASSHTGTLYTGMTRNIAVRLEQHKSGNGGRFSSKYSTVNLVYCEIAESLEGAREREAQIKRWARWKKVQLIEKSNPYWRDISGTIG